MANASQVIEMQAEPTVVPESRSLDFCEQLVALLACQQRHWKGNTFVGHHPTPELRLLRRRSANERQQQAGKSESAPHDCCRLDWKRSRVDGINMQILKRLNGLSDC